MRTNASISRRHIGHDRNEWLHGAHVVKCPHGIHAIRFSSSRQRTQRFDGVVSDSCSSVVVEGVDCIIFVSY